MRKFLLSAIIAGTTLSASAINDVPAAQWGYLFGGSKSSGDQSTAIAVTSEGNVLWLNTANTDDSAPEVYYNNTTVFSNDVTANNLVLLCTDEHGNKLWEAHSTTSDAASNQGGVAVDQDGNIILSAKLRQVVPEGGVSELNFIDATGVETRFGGEVEKRFYQIAIIKLTPDGEMLWAKVFKQSTAPAPAASGSNAEFTSDAVSSSGLAIDDDGNIYVGGNYCTDMTIDDVTLRPTNVSTWTGDSQTTCGNMFLVKLDKDGNYLSSLIGEGDINGASTLQALDWTDGKLYLYGYAKGSGSFSFAGTNLTPTLVNSPVVGALNADLTPSWLKCFPSETVDSKSALQNVGLSVYGNALWLAGQYNQKISDPDDNENYVAATQGSQREGFVIKLDKTTGAWLASADSRIDFPEIKKICGYFKVIQNSEIPDKAFVFGYTMDATQGIFLREYNAETLAVNSDHAWNIVTGGGVPSCVAANYVQTTNELYLTGRGNKAFTLMGNPEITTGSTNSWDVLMAKFSMPAATTTAINAVADDVKAVPQDVYDLFGRRVGTTAERLSPGIYISSHKKFIVR